MRNPQFWLYYILLVAAQIVIAASLNFSPLVTFWYLPMLVLCIPIRLGTSLTLIIAFVTGLAVDFLSQGILGLTAASLLPVAFTKNLIIRLVFGSELFSRGEDISVRRQGIPKMAIAIVMVTAIFLLVFIAADGAGTRPFLFNLGRFSLSLLAGSVFSLILVSIFDPGESSRWK